MDVQSATRRSAELGAVRCADSPVIYSCEVFVYLLRFRVCADRIIRVIRITLSRRRRLTVKIQPVLNPVFGPFPFESLRSGCRGDIESRRGENDGTDADSRFGGASGHPALTTANDWGEDVALVPDSLQHSVHFAAQFNQ